MVKVAEQQGAIKRSNQVEWERYGNPAPIDHSAAGKSNRRTSSDSASERGSGVRSKSTGSKHPLQSCCEMFSGTRVFNTAQIDVHLISTVRALASA
jgi:hypothetical protein